jgi:excisionase family DNA binding protein
MRPHDLERVHLPILRSQSAMKIDDDAWSLVMVIPPDRAVLDPAGARLVVRLLDSYVRTESGLSPEARRLRGALARVASSRGHPDTSRAQFDAPLPHDEIGTAEAADRLGYSVRHTSRLAEAGAFGSSRVVSGRRLVSCAEVDAYLAAHQKPE